MRKNNCVEILIQNSYLTSALGSKARTIRTEMTDKQKLIAKILLLNSYLTSALGSKARTSTSFRPEMTDEQK